MYMKRKISTGVLFVLLLLTVFALQHLAMPAAVSTESVAQIKNR